MEKPALTILLTFSLKFNGFCQKQKVGSKLSSVEFLYPSLTPFSEMAHVKKEQDRNVSSWKVLKICSGRFRVKSINHRSTKIRIKRNNFEPPPPS